MSGVEPANAAVTPLLSVCLKGERRVKGKVLSYSFQKGSHLEYSGELKGSRAPSSKGASVVVCTRKPW